MIIFEEPAAAPFVGLALAALLFAVQLLLCFKAKRTVVRMLPLSLILICMGFILLLCTGVFGTGSGFLGNVHLIAAIILGIVAGIAGAGVAAAWVVYWVCQKRKSD